MKWKERRRYLKNMYLYEDILKKLRFLRKFLNSEKKQTNELQKESENFGIGRRHKIKNQNLI